jgi:hypothetical protein
VRGLLTNFAQLFNTIDNAQSKQAPRPVELFFKKISSPRLRGTKADATAEISGGIAAARLLFAD